MRRILILVLVIVLAACSAPTPPSPSLAAPQPTEVQPSNGTSPTANPEAAASPTIEVAAAPEATATQSATQTATPEPSPTAQPVDASLSGAVWQWSESSRPGCDLIIFTPPDQMQIQSDCQSAAATFQSGAGGSLSIAVPAGLSGILPGKLGQVSSYLIKDGYLMLALADGSTLKFTPGGLLSAPPPASDGASAGDGASAVMLYNAPVYAGPGRVYPLLGYLPAGSSAGVAIRIYKYDFWGLAMPGYPDGVAWVPKTAVKVDGEAKIPYQQIENMQVGGIQLLWPDVGDPRASVTSPVKILGGPAETYPLLLAGMPGDTFYVVGRSEDQAYVQILMPPGLIPGDLGWLRVDQVEVSNVENSPIFKAPPAPTKLRFIQPAPGEPFEAALTQVNIRAGPGTEYPVLESAQRGEFAPITGVTDDGIWWRIRVPTSVWEDGNAWISAPNTRAFNDVSGVAVVPWPMPFPWMRSDTLGPPCQVVSQKPRELQFFPAGFTYTVEIAIRNNTDTTWSDNDTDFVYIDNIDDAPMHAGPDRLDLEGTAMPGQTITFKIDAMAPAHHDGLVYGERWVVRRHGGTVCAFSYQIRTRTPPK
jgi:uncharacterized protein YraI